MTDDTFDDALHDQLLSALTGGKLKSKPIQKKTEDVGAAELLNAIHSTKNVKESRQSIASKKKVKARKSVVTTHKTLQAPLHRTEIEKIQRRIGFNELEKDLKVWEPVVSEHIHTPNLEFPLNREKFNIDTAATRNDGFVARTPLEKAMDAVLANSKCNLSNTQEYTQDEMEIIKAMNVAEAKEKLAKLRRLRSLQSFQEAKFRRQKKIKSKNYHRIMKRAKRREELKELDELFVRDPDAARAKLAELDKDRVYERATLKHRSQNNLSKVLARRASKDPNMKKLLDDHIRFGKEMKEKIGMESGEDSAEDSEGGEGGADLIEDVLEEVEKAEMDEETAKQKLKSMRKEKERKIREEKERAQRKVEIVELVPFIEEEEEEKEEENKKGRKRKAVKGEKEANVKKAKEEIEEMKKEEEEEERDVDEMFDQIEEKVSKKGEEMEKKNKKKEGTKVKKTNKEDKEMKKKGRSKKEKEDNNTIDDDQLMLDPNNYLISETSKLMQVGPDMDDGNDLIDENNMAQMGEAFVDDDVMAEFVDDKAELQEEEKEKDVDLTLLGWGSWTGPGMANKKKKKFVVKAKDKERKDKGKVGLIISEKRITSMDALQPKSVPFPFTRMEDYEASLSQPIGKEWNSLGSHATLIKGAVSTQGGRVILPMSKADVLKTQMAKADEW